MADIRNTEKPNVIKADKSGFGELVTPATGWTTQAPNTDSPGIDHSQDMYSPEMVGAQPGSMDHNSEWLDDSPQD
jgi:hypothetical protein